jgi:hypothetical protein
MVVYACIRTFYYFYKYSIKHEYEGQWNDKTRLTTCDPHAKRTVINSETPQEVEEKKEIIFTYDVEFQVSYHLHIKKGICCLPLGLL